MTRGPIGVCAYGWGQMLRLYHDHLDINGTSYALAELVRCQPVYHHVLGIPAARLELHFKRQVIVLRGIVEVDALRTIVTYLANKPSITAPLALTAPLVRPSPLAGEPAVSFPARHLVPLVLCAPAQDGAWEYPGDHSQVTSHTTALTMYAQGTGVIETPITPAVVPSWYTEYQEQLERRLDRLKQLRAERLVREHGFDVEELVLYLREERLPQIAIPISLPAGESAHYYTEATLYSEQVDVLVGRKFRPRDQGILILTNMRIIYLGRKRQIMVGYEQLLQVSRMRNMVALLAEQWNKRQFFEMRRPLECTMYLECILQRFERSTGIGPLQSQTFPVGQVLSVQEVQEQSVMEQDTTILDSYALVSYEPYIEQTIRMKAVKRV